MSKVTRVNSMIQFKLSNADACAKMYVRKYGSTNEGVRDLKRMYNQAQDRHNRMLSNDRCKKENMHGIIQQWHKLLALSSALRQLFEWDTFTGAPRKEEANHDYSS